MSGFIEKLGDLILRLWEHGQNVLWGLASAAAAVFTILLVGWWLNWAPFLPFFDSYAVPALLTAVVAGILGLARNLEARSKPPFHLIADEGQSFWSQTRQKDGR